MKSMMLKSLTLVFLAVPLFAGNDKNFTYLALGDSVPFGMNITLLPPYAQQLPTPSEFVGYPETLASALHLLQSNKLVNASCPGESSGSFLNTAVRDNGCNSPHVDPTEPPFKTTIGLHTSYTGPQMDFASAQFAANKHISLVTLSIGANDVLLVLPALEQCTTNTCIDGVLAPVLQTYAANLAQILTRIRAQYQGTLVLMTYYSPAPALDTVTQALNTVMTQTATQLESQKNFAPVIFADGYTAFQLASAPFGHDACKAGLLIKLPASPPPPSPCDVHPSPAGRDLLAATVALSLLVN